MYDDLLEARACIDWVRGQIENFDVRIKEWLETKTSIQVRATTGSATHDVVVVHEHEWLPLSFSIEFGAYLNTLRSSLDVLAMTLVRRNSIAMPDEDVYFPIAVDEATLRRKELVRRLPLDDQQTLLSIKPYRDGNPTLWVLHRLDIVRKHRRLLALRPEPGPCWFSSDFEPIHGRPIEGAPGDTVFGLLKKGAPLDIIMMGIFVVINEVDAFAPFEIVSLLRGLAFEANRAIDLFDQ